jgi:hypothetical protein
MGQPDPAIMNGRIAMIAVLGALACGPAHPLPEHGQATPVAAPRATPHVVDAAVRADDAPADVAAPRDDAAPGELDDAPRRPLRDAARVVATGATSGLVAFVEQLPPGGLAWVGPLAGNGDRDVLVYVPPPVRHDAPIELVFHFHGTHSERVAQQRPGMAKKEWVGWDRVQQTVDATGDLHAKSDRNIALVYPLSAGKRPEPDHVGWFNKEYDRMWMRGDATPPESFDALHEQVRGVMREHFDASPQAFVPRVIAEGHSAGGLPLRAIAESGTTAVGEYIFLDASFQGWADGCHRGTQAGAAPGLVSVVITEGGIADPYGKSDPWCTTAPDDAAAWPEHRAACEGGAKRVPGTKRTCAQLSEAARDWPKQRAWCDALVPGAPPLPGLFVLRTRIPHGKQPRHFVGGLELPADRLPK